MEEDTAMSPWPSRATSIEVRRSGTEVPAARMVMPMMCSCMPTVSAITLARKTMNQVKIAIQMIDMMKVITKNFLQVGPLRTSGTVITRMKIIGNVRMYEAHVRTPA